MKTMTIKAAPPYNKTEIKDLTKDQLVLWFETRAMRSFRALQVMRWIYLRQVDTFEQMTDINKTTRTLLSASFDNKRLVLRQTETSADGSQKFLFQLGDGNTIESVLIPEKEHDTLCISSQVGCAQGCRFCMTAKGGLIRNLFTWEIIAQVRDIQQLADHSGRLTNIVFMGMGEPLANYDNVVKAIQVITDGDTGLKFSNRRVTLSTAGLVPKMQRLGKDTQVNLAISLNAADNAVRSRLMPVNRKYPLEKLLDACAAYPLKRRKKITFEYILIKGVNDSAADAESLAVLLKKLPSKINLIPYNEHAGSPFERPDESTIEQFQNILINNNFTTIIRRSKGRDIAAACGQLRARYMEP
jgi:23S rRNA (adenine2503-C2)-methyltransferase